MIDSYKEGKRGDLKFLKNRLRKAAHNQALKKAHHHSWKEVHDKVHKTLPGPVASAVDPQASAIQLWPPFSVANAAAVSMHGRPTQSGSVTMQPSTSMMSSTVQMSLQQRTPTETPLQQPSAPQAMYSNLIPAYYIPPHISSNAKPSGGYFVSVPTIFSQQPLQVQTFQGKY